MCVCFMYVYYMYMLTFDFFSHLEEAYLQKAEFEIRLVELLILLLPLLFLSL